MKRFMMVVFFLTCALPSVVFAQDQQNTGYIGIGFGQSTADVDYGAPLLPASTISIDDSDTMFKLFGGIHINPKFDLDFGFIHFGEVSVTERNAVDFIDISYESWALYGAAVGYVPLSEQAHLFGKAGLAAWRADGTLNTSVPLVVTDDSDDGIDIMIGIGFQYTFDAIMLRAEYERYTEIADEAVDVIGLGIAYSF